MKTNWTKGDRPPDHGYYLATWRAKGGDKFVSELWYNPTTGWFSSRGYLDQVGIRQGGDQIRETIVAWAPMPEPA